jgi:MarR family transcriptional regulator, temperature-dependent positive regulator of motility
MRYRELVRTPGEFMPAASASKLPPSADPTEDSAPVSAPSSRRILKAILRSGWVDHDGFRLSLWSGFYTTPVFQEIERNFGLLRDENNILFCLTTYGPLTAKSISDVLGRPKNSISRAVERLLRRQLIRRKKVEADRRHTLLTVEREGIALIKKTTAMFRARENEMLRSLSSTERVALDQILARLMDDAENWMLPG